MDLSSKSPESRPSSGSPSWNSENHERSSPSSTESIVDSAVESPNLDVMSTLQDLCAKLQTSPVISAAEKATKRIERIKRPMNAFMVWSQMRRQQLSAKGERLHNSDISKMLGAEWRDMTEDGKAPFIDKARHLRDEHFREHPDYVYRPRRRNRGVVKPVEEGCKTNGPTAKPSISIPAVPFIDTQLLFQNLMWNLLCQPAKQQN